MANRTCSIEGCEKPHSARGFCSMHYKRWRRGTDLNRPMRTAKGTCSIEGCEQKHYGRGWCAMHYGRWRYERERLNRPPAPIRVRTPLVERFWPRVNRDGPVPSHRPDLGPCWIWTGGVGSHGYGALAKSALAHRFSWELHNGPIPSETPCVLHHCDTRRCVRPDHLFLGTRADNTADMISKGRHRNKYSGKIA